MGPKPSKEEEHSSVSRKFTQQSVTSAMKILEEKNETLKFVIILEKIKCQNLTQV